MTALTDLAPQVITYLLTQAASNASLGGASPPVIIIDGQPATQDVLTVNETGLTKWLWIGADGMAPPGSMGHAATGTQAFSFLDQARTRDDTIEVQCAAEAVAGSGVMSEARAGAYAVVAAVELMLRGSPGTSPASPGDASMGGLVYWSEVISGELEQGQRAAGAGALVKFRVKAFVRLTS